MDKLRKIIDNVRESINLEMVLSEWRNNSEFAEDLENEIKQFIEYSSNDMAREQIRKVIRPIINQASNSGALQSDSVTVNNELKERLTDLLLNAVRNKVHNRDNNHNLDEIRNVLTEITRSVESPYFLEMVGALGITNNNDIDMRQLNRILNIDTPQSAAAAARVAETEANRLMAEKL